MKKVVKINRAKWRTGSYSSNMTGKGATVLINNEGYKCCLGFICQQKLRINKKQIAGGYPASLQRQIHQLTTIKDDNIVDTKLSDDAMIINDSGQTTPKQKEEALLKLFKNTDYDLQFFGEYSENLNR